MTRLPTVLPKAVVAALQRAGFEIDHQTGSHVILRHPVTLRRTVVAVHAEDLPRATLKRILKQAGLSEEEFRGLL
jgi:predicted RNA binding protein YcfA (HicA-like mRNA interferase family)